jgi:RNA polymerase sigma factor (sigma-70 family)
MPKDSDMILAEIAKAQAGNSRSEGFIIKHYSSYVEYMVKRYSKKTAIKDDDDLRSYIQMGLLEAIRKYNSNMNTLFIYFAHTWMKKYIFMSEPTHRFIKLPANQNALYSKIKKKQATDKNSKEEYVDEEEAKILLTYSSSSVTMFTDLCLVNSAGEVESATIPEKLYKNNAMGVFSEEENKLVQSTLKRNISTTLSIFSEKERFVIESLFGLTTKGYLSVEELARELNVTKVTIMFIKNKVIRLLRHSSLTNQLINEI